MDNASSFSVAILISVAGVVALLASAWMFMRLQADDPPNPEHWAIKRPPRRKDVEQRNATISLAVGALCLSVAAYFFYQSMPPPAKSPVEKKTQKKQKALPARRSPD